VPTTGRRPTGLARLKPDKTEFERPAPSKRRPKPSGKQIMRVTLERSNLLKSLNHVHRVVERRNTIPILSNVL
jgi:DNA polymerase-3 subunit beta